MARHDDDDDFDDDPYDRPSRRRRRERDDLDIRQSGESKRMAAGLCGILVGGFGVHKFILGYGLEGAILLTLTLVGIIVGGVGGVCCVIPFVLLAMPMISGIIGLVEGIIYLTKSDEEFIETYQVGHRPWF